MCEQMKNKVIASLVLGIISVVFAWFGWGALVALACGIVGLVFAVQIRKACEAAGEKPNNMAMAGFVLSIIGVVLSGVLFVIVLACAGTVGCAACAAASSIG